jgi:TAG lipase/lysophosphatidylethanolamine acyltransferase
MHILGKLIYVDKMNTLLNALSPSTKHLIEDYADTVVRLLEMISNAPPEKLTYQQKAEFFRDTRQCFGRSALVLHGGSTFGKRTTI